MPTYKIGFPGWPEPILDSVTGFGASIRKRGLAPAPFSISKASFSVPAGICSSAHRGAPTRMLPFALIIWMIAADKGGSKKMSGRWGDRPLGRGDGGYCNQKSLWAFWPFRCAREQQDDTQEQTGHYRCNTPEHPATSDYSASLLPTPTFRR